MRYFEGYTIAKFDDGTTGNVIAAASVEVRKVSDNSLATLYSTDNTGGATLSNPLTTNSNGKYAFYAVNDRYKITASKSGVSIVDASLDDVLFFDVVDGGAAIKTAYEAEADTNAFTDAEKTKLSGIATGADVTNSTNVIAAIAEESIAPATVTTTGNLGVRSTPPPVVSLGAYGQGTTSSTYSIAAYNGSSEVAFGVRDNKLAEFYGNTEIFGDAKLDNGSVTTSANVLNFQTSGVVDGYISHAANTATLEISSGRSVAWGGDIKLITDTVTALSIDNSQTVSPGTDNTQDFGSASFRWAEFFAGNGTINTSDETQKTEITALTDTEKAAYLAVKNIIGSYKWLDAIDEKGEAARIHVGVGAQSAIAEFTSRGLDWQKYACFCLDDVSVYETQTVTESHQVKVTKTREVTSIEVIGGVATQITKTEEYDDPQFNIVGVVDESGSAVMIDKVIGKTDDGEDILELVQMTHNVPIMENVEVEKQVLVPAGQRYGIRYNELIMGILASI